MQRHFQISYTHHGKTLYIDAEKVYSYEHASKLRVGDETQTNLLQDIEDDEFYTEPRPNRFDLGRLQSFFKDNSIDFDNVGDMEKLKAQFADGPVCSSYIVNELIKFCRTVPMMPDYQKNWITSDPINLDGVKSADDARDALKSQRRNETVDLAFMAFRDLSASPWKPFLKAAIERNPVCLIGADGLTLGDAYKCLSSPSFAEESIYDEETRLAQPDEVWNYKRGDGLEKAITLASIHINKNPESNVAIDINSKDVKLTCGKDEFLFSTNKNLAPPKNEDFVWG
jgi:hypothetical protein